MKNPSGVDFIDVLVFVAGGSIPPTSTSSTNKRTSVQIRDAWLI
jgi:hypothetical protein